MNAVKTARTVEKKFFMGKAIILLGTNLGDKHQNLAKAVAAISEHGTLVQTSGIYESPAWGYDSTHTYFNQVVILRTELAPEALLETLLAIETSLGRLRLGEGYADRTLDLDVLDYDGIISDNEHLTLPHPRLHLRLFTLLPMAEVAPAWKHPVLGLTMDALLSQCPDTVKPERL